MSIGVVTSTKFSGPIKEAFLKGLRAHGWEADPGVDPGGKSQVSMVPYEADGKYDDGDGGSGKRKELYNAVSTFDADPNIDLIIAAGGLVSAHAAMTKSAQTPFLAIFGTTPSFNLGSNPNFRGGVNLDMIAKDADRNAELCRLYGISDPKKIALIWNSRSKMGKSEKKAWVTDRDWPLHQEVKKNAESDIGAAFTNAKAAGAKAVVVSGDPFFTSRMNAVVAAANGSRLKVCYPFAVYKTANPAPTPGSAVIFGPNLEDAYNVMGQKAAAILSALASGAAAPSTGLDVAKTGNPQPLKKNSEASKK
jgi:hypothetical protein